MILIRAIEFKNEKFPQILTQLIDLEPLLCHMTLSILLRRLGNIFTNIEAMQHMMWMVIDRWNRHSFKSRRKLSKYKIQKFSVTLLYANDRSLSGGMDWVVTRTNIEQCKRLKMLFFTPKDGMTLNCKFNKLLLSLAEEWDIVGVNKKYVNNQANMTSWNIYENECCKWGWWCDTQGRRRQFLSSINFTSTSSVVRAKYFHSHSTAHYKNVNIPIFVSGRARLWPPKSAKNIYCQLKNIFEPQFCA